MLSTVVYRAGSRRRLALSVIAVRWLTAESVPSSSSPASDILFPPAKHPIPPKSRSAMLPQPRRAVRTRQSLPKLPPSFGNNQLLPVSNSTRALLESIVSHFDAPIRYAFAYGSGVFEQDGYNHATANVPAKDPKSGPMLDFMFAVTHPGHFHSINIHQNPTHYTLHAKLFGSDYISRVQDIGPGVWFNTFVPMNGVNIKYGVTTIDNLCSDLLNWNSLYLAGRMHKPLRIIKDDARVRLTQQVNLTSAIRSALLTLPASFTDAQLFQRIAGMSYSGDIRMALPAENRNKVTNIVSRQLPQFREVYYRLVVGLPGVRWDVGSENIEQDVNPQARAAHLKKLPSNLLAGVKRHYERESGIPRLESDEIAYWTKLAGDEQLEQVIRKEIANIVRYPAAIQTVKGIVSAGLGKSLKYASGKVSKWWKSSGGSSLKDPQ